MDKTVNINLGGSLFQMEEEAYLLLNDYINSINARFRHTAGGAETIEDIEYRIAEIFRSGKGLTGVISRETVENMIAVIGKPEEIDSDEEEVPVNEKTSEKINYHGRRLYRNPDDRIIGGVSGGLGAYLNTDPLLFRILFVVFAFIGGAGLLIYLVMWIAVPSANTEVAKMELFGNDYKRRRSSYARGANNGAHEIITMTGKAFYIMFRIVLIFLGTTLVLTGFICIMVYIIVFILNYPGAFSSEGFEYSINYLEMLKYMFSPETSRWILTLISLVIILPLVALVYWGTRMIFWFRARDGFINLAGFILWMMALSGLTIIFFREGVSFAETSSVTTRNILPAGSDTLYLKMVNKTDEIDYEQKILLNDHPKLFFLADSAGNKYMNPSIRLMQSDDNSPGIEIQKRSSGRTKKDAAQRAESINYGYSVDHDTIILNNCFALPSSRKWSGDFVRIKLSLPENSVLYADEDIVESFGLPREYDYRDEDAENNFWVYSEGRLKKTH